MAVVERASAERLATERMRSGGDRLVSPIIVGREVERKAILGAFDVLPRVILITGDAGMGKTRLCEAVLDSPELRGHRVLQGHCYPLREPFPFGPLVEALRGALGSSGRAHAGIWLELFLR